MIFGKTKLELKVGLFVFIGLLILVTFVLSIGGIKTWSSGYHLTFIYNFANGVKLGAPVRFAGIDAGEVKKISFIFVPQDNTMKIEIFCWLRKEVKVPIDSEVWVNTLGLLGEKYIEIMPGKDYNHVLTPNQYFVGIDPIPMHNVTRQLKRIADNVDLGINRINNKEGTVGKLLYEDSIYNELEAFIKDIRKNPWKIFWKTKEKK